MHFSTASMHFPISDVIVFGQSGQWPQLCLMWVCIEVQTANGKVRPPKGTSGSGLFSAHKRLAQQVGSCRTITSNCGAIRQQMRKLSPSKAVFFTTHASHHFRVEMQATKRRPNRQCQSKTKPFQRESPLVVNRHECDVGSATYVSSVGPTPLSDPVLDEWSAPGAAGSSALHG
mmetsp:Transcript_78891/g.139411  ORF Transcript_78891/g.139411 Transcript_78891/m.139411 type:complete len:174 (-) Transcript_78891:133-654(-)